MQKIRRSASLANERKNVYETSLMPCRKIPLNTRVHRCGRAGAQRKNMQMSMIYPATLSGNSYPVLKEVKLRAKPFGEAS